MEKKLAMLTQIAAIKVGIEEKRQFIRRKWAKIAEISYNNIDPPGIPQDMWQRCFQH
jgi:hypothetical protein